MCKKLFVLLLLVAFTASMASAAIITSVDRTRGTDGNRDVIGAFDKDTDPIPAGTWTYDTTTVDVGQIKDDYLVYSDRTYVYTNTHAHFDYVVWEQVPTFNTDKDKENIIVNYAMEIAEAAHLWISIDDRIPDQYDSEGENEFESQQEAVDLIVHSWAAPGTFVDTDYDVFIKGDNDRRMSVYMTTDPVAAGTYDFKLHPTGKNFYQMGAVPEPATIALLGLGGLALLRRRRS